MDRYDLQRDGNNVIVADTVVGIVVVFEVHKFNDTQQVKFFKDVKPDAMYVAKVMREMADWLRDNHYNLVF